MKKGIVFMIVLLFVSAGSVFADFREDEKPVVLIHADTAYTLSQGEWSLDLVGPVTYGILDTLHVGTNFWVWFLQVPNVYGKWNVIQENDVFPALSIGGLFGMFQQKTTAEGTSEEIKATFMLYTGAVYASKKVTEQLYLNGSFSYGKLDITLENESGEQLSMEKMVNDLFGTTDTFGLSIASLGLAYELSKGARLMAEAIGLIHERSTNFLISPGIEWGIGDIFRLKLAVTVWTGDTPFYAPYINAKWRLK
ncbi:MAG TPA: hypothetical protein ENN43_06605 [bacterium]|nr:hypothetical protein [bacterium]